MADLASSRLASDASNHVDARNHLHNLKSADSSRVCGTGAAQRGIAVHDNNGPHASPPSAHDPMEILIVLIASIVIIFASQPHFDTGLIRLAT